MRTGFHVFYIGAATLLLVSGVSHADPCPSSGATSGQVNGLVSDVGPIFSASGVTYTTSAKQVFTQVIGPGSFGTGWRAPDGTVWSGYQGKFTNEQLSPDNGGTIQDSPAANACRKIGGYLPSACQYRQLMTYFDKDGSNPPVMTGAHGQADWKALFRDPGLWGRYWTSSNFAEPDDASSAYLFGWSFQSSSGVVDSDVDRGRVGPDAPPPPNQFGVRCVDRPDLSCVNPAQ